MKGTEPVDTVSYDGMPEGRLRKDCASKDGSLRGQPVPGLRVHEKDARGHHAKVHHAKGWHAHGHSAQGRIREGSLSKIATKGTLQKGPNPKCTEPKGHVPKDVELKCNKPVDTMSHDGMPECLRKEIASESSMHKGTMSKCVLSKGSMPVDTVSKGGSPLAASASTSHSRAACPRALAQVCPVEGQEAHGHLVE
jgi:hypothetical protein